MEQPGRVSREDAALALLGVRAPQHRPETDFRQIQNSCTLLKLNFKYSDLILDFLMSEIGKFATYLPLILTLGNVDLRPRHWMQLLPLLGVNQNFALNEILGAELQMERISEISSVASSEYLIQSQLDQIQSKWEHLEFDIQFSDNKYKYLF